MDENQWRAIEVFCRQNQCSRIVQGVDGKPTGDKRKMFFSGFTFWGAAAFICPVCGRQRRFRERTFGTGIQEVS